MLKSTFSFKVDLIDMSTSCDGEYRWIGHVVDHFSKYHVLFPLLRKEASEVAANLTSKVFSYFGLPFILHSDRGKEFVANVIKEVVNLWPGECKLVNGKPRSPWVQGLVERTNACVEDMISAKQVDLKSNEWVSWLPEIQCKFLNIITDSESIFVMDKHTFGSNIVVEPSGFLSKFGYSRVINWNNT